MKLLPLIIFMISYIANSTNAQTIDSIKVENILGDRTYVLKTSFSESIYITVDNNFKIKNINFFSIDYPLTFKYQNDKKRGFEIISNHPQSDTFWRIFFYKSGELWGIENLSYKKGGAIGLFVSLNKKGGIIEQSYR